MPKQPKPKPTQKSSADLGDIHASIEDMKRQLDAIVKAMIAPQLGKNEREARNHLSKHIKTELAAKIWNAIDGKRDVEDCIGGWQKASGSKPLHRKMGAGESSASLCVYRVPRRACLQKNLPNQNEGEGSKAAQA